MQATFQRIQYRKVTEYSQNAQASQVDIAEYDTASDRHLG